MAKVMEKKGLSKRTRSMADKMLVVPSICVEKVRWFTASYKETEGQPPIIRRGKALKKLFENIPIAIEDEEIIVGKTSSKRARGGVIHPEIRAEHVLTDLDDFGTRPSEPLLVTEEDKAVLRETIPYWKGKSGHDILLASVPESASKKLAGSMVSHLEASVLSCIVAGYNMHSIHAYDKVLAKGLNGIKEEIDEEVAKLDLRKMEDCEKFHFYEAAKTCLDAVIILANRYAELAKRKAAMEADPTRKAELEKLAEICSWVPANPARSFHEALQAIWFVHIGLRNEGGGAIALGRVDQYLYPFYKEDIEGGILTKEEARELIAQFLIKLNDYCYVHPNLLTRILIGYPLWANCILGGLTTDGKDGVNELSYLFLETDGEVKLPVNEMVIRVSEKTPIDFLMKAIEYNKKAGGKFKYAGDDTVIKKLVRMGVPLERARNYGLTGCSSPAIQGYSYDSIPMTIYPVESLELALNNGTYRMTGGKVGLETGDPRKFKTYEEVFEAFKKQVEFVVSKQIVAANLEQRVLSTHVPAPLASALLDDCIKRGKDMTAGGAAFTTNALDCGQVADVADGLAAIKKLVFDEKKVTMERFIDALDHNFEGYEDVLHLIKSCPKYGNDDDYVDSIAKSLVDYYDELRPKYQPLMPFDFKFTPMALGGGMGVYLGEILGAGADGRRVGESIVEGGVSAHQGRSVMGPVATFKSVAKLDLTRYHGAILNMKFNPNAVKGEEKLRKFASMIKTYFKTGGFHVQFNIIDSKTLKAAQREPEKYRDLLVRVATWSAYFVELEPAVQNDIIARTEFQEVV